MLSFLAGSQHLRHYMSMTSKGVLPHDPTRPVRLRKISVHAALARALTSHWLQAVDGFLRALDALSLALLAEDLLSSGGLQASPAA